jgi:hypothetical protein
VLSATNVVSTATQVESVQVGLLEEAPPLQETSAKEATAASKKIDFFIVFYFILCTL